MVRLAAAEDNAADFARYQRQLTEVEPSDTNQVALIKGLLANDEADAALDALGAHVQAIVKTPGAWDELLPLLTQKALTGKAGDLLARELGGEKADARNRFTLALFQLTAGHLDEAKAALWDIFSLRSPHAAAPVKPPAPPAATPAEAYLVFYGDGGTPAEQRLADAVRARPAAQALLDPETNQGGQSLNSFFASAPVAATAGHPDPLDTTRDTALIYLAALALKQNAAGPFLAELDRRLAARDGSREDRLVAYASVDAAGPLLREIAAQAHAPEPDLDIFCAWQLYLLALTNEQANAAANNGGTPPEGQGKLTPAQIEVMGPLAEILFRRVTLERPEAAEVLDTTRIAFYNALGLKQKADEIQSAFLARIDEHASPNLLGEALDLLITGDLGAPERAQTRTLARALATGLARTHNVNLRQSALAVPAALLANTDGGAAKLTPADLGSLLADLMVLWYPAGPPPAPGTPVPAATSSGQPRQWVSSAALNLEGDFLPPVRYLDADISSAIEQVEGQLQQRANNNGGDGTALAKTLHDALARQAQALPEAQRFYPLLVSVYTDFSQGDAPAALTTAQALLATRPADVDLRLLTAIILARLDRTADAIALLQAAGEVHDPDAARYVQYGILTFAGLAEDKETARAAARRLAAMTVPPEERDELVEKLRELDLKAEADRLDQSVSAVATQAALRQRNGLPSHASVLDYDTLEQLQALEKDKNTAGALALVRNVLAALPATGQAADQGDAVAASALQTLDRLHKRDDFIAEARKQIASDPDSLALNYQLALLCGPRTGEEQKNPRLRYFSDKLPFWVRLTRDSDGQVSGAYSADGKRWVRLGHAPVALGAAPEAALAAVGWGNAAPGGEVRAESGEFSLRDPSEDPSAGETDAPPADKTVGATADSVAMKPDSAPSGSTPETLGGTLALRGSDNGQDTPDWDALPTVHQPLGAAQEMAVRVTAFAGPDARSRPAVAVMFRASLAPDAPFAAVLVGHDGGASFVSRLGPDASLPYWHKLATLRPKEARYTRLLASHLAEDGKWEEAATLYDSLFSRDPDEIISHYGEFATFYQHDVVRLANLLLNWQPGPANGRRGSPGGLYTDTARRCVAAHRDDLAVPLARRAAELNSALGN
ncbi:MAG: hypothetical protein INR64_11805, partial [Caulobacteraceae bacterium]|nr:hypothetical protein [Caulobacter sp.]